MNITVVLLTFNGARTLPEVLTGLERQTRPPDRVIAVDNGSSDGTTDLLREGSTTLELIELPQNVGVGAGYNLGWRTAVSDLECTHIWTLENDSIPTDTLLEQLVEGAQQLAAKRVPYGCLLPRQVHPSEWLRHDVARLPNIVNPHVVEKSTLTFNGALIPVGAIGAAGYLREEFFVDQEDREFSFRLRSLGFRIYQDRSAVVLHYGKGKRRRREPRSVARTYYSTRNGIYMRTRIRREFLGVPRVILRSIATLTAAGFSNQEGRSEMIYARWRGLVDGLRGDLGKKSYSFLE